MSFLNIASKSASSACLGLPGAQASAAADSQRKGRSSSLSFSSLVGIPTSTESWRTASMAAYIAALRIARVFSFSTGLS